MLKNYALSIKVPHKPLLVYNVYQIDLMIGTYGGENKEERKRDYNWPSIRGSKLSGTWFTNRAHHKQNGVFEIGVILLPSSLGWTAWPGLQPAS